MKVVSGMIRLCRSLKRKPEQGVVNSVVRINNPGKVNESFPNQIVNSIARIDRIGIGCRINGAEVKGNVKIGDFVSIWGPNIKIASLMKGISIGSFSSIALNCVMLDYNHRFDRPTSYFILKNLFKDENATIEELSSNGPITLEEDVWIGAGCVVLSGVTIGRGSVIGAGSVVTKSIPPYSIAFGNPARPYKSRFSPDQIEYLEDLKWWTWDIDKILENKEFFHNPVNPENLRPRE